MKLERKHDLNVLYQVCVFWANWKNKMATLASDWLRSHSHCEKKLCHRHVGLQVWELITRSQFDDWGHIIHHWKGDFHSFEMIFPQDQKSRYATAKYELFYCSFVKPKQRYLAHLGPRYHNKKENL